MLLLLECFNIFCGCFENKQIDGTKNQRIVCISKHLAKYVYALGKGII